MSVYMCAFWDTLIVYFEDFHETITSVRWAPAVERW